MAKNLFKTGDIVRIQKSFLGEPEGIHGYVYEEYNLDFDNIGVSVVTQNGVNLGGFSACTDYVIFDTMDFMESEQEQFLTYVRDSGYQYKFKNVIQLDKDFDKLIKPLFNI